jgi:DeoR/GlpR family transcriptional regulator of sugar metabolism
VVADHTKWETAGLASIAGLAAASVVVSDDKLASRARNVLTEVGVEVMLASTDGEDEAPVDPEDTIR